MIVAYLRVSTEKQTLANQQNEISKFADSRSLHVDRWVTEIVSGKKKGRERKLGTLLRRMKRGDTMIVTELSRLSRTLTDIIAIVGELLKKEVCLYSTKDHYAFDDTINSKVLCFAFGLVAEIERNLISMRTREALALRREQGIVLGRRKGSYTKQQQLIDDRREIVSMMNRGHSVAAICANTEWSGIRSTDSGNNTSIPSCEVKENAGESMGTLRSRKKRRSPTRRKRSNSERAPITARHSEEGQAGKARVMPKFGEEHFGHAAHVQPNLFTDTIL